MRKDNFKNKKIINKKSKHSKRKNTKEYNSQNNRNSRNIKNLKNNKVHKNLDIEFSKLNSNKEMSDQRRKYIKRSNALILFFYILFSLYSIVSYFNWRSLILPMMKNQHSTIIDSKGNVLEVLGTERKQNNVDITQIPENLKNAYIDIEDQRFYSHEGVDVKRTAGAIVTYVKNFGKSSFGGSTITQQLVKNLTGNDDSSIFRKVDEWAKAIALESFCTKEEILESYFNIIYIAPNTYGVDMGAKYYFDKELSELTLSECAFLAGINNSPNSYNPFNGKDNSEKIKKRTKTVLNKMLELGHITQDEYNLAIADVENGLDFKNAKLQAEGDGIYSYHTDALISEAVSEISKKKNIEKEFATNYIYMAGLTIYSTEDEEIQSKLEKEYLENKYVIKSDLTGNSSQSAMIILDHSTGHVLGCVGGLGKKNTSRGFNRATQAIRQTGSASKPLAVLVPGIEQKVFTASTIYEDEPTTFNDGTEEGYSPSNNEDYIGKITVRRAVESSQNIPFVKMMEQITPKTSIKYLEKMGITTLTDKDKSLMLSLGGLEKGITPLEMAGAYATIANNGVYIEPTFFTKIEDSKGKNVITKDQKKTTVFSEDVAYILKQLLKQPVEGSNGTAKYCKIDGMDIAAKTGTTNNNYDKWICGFTTYYTAVTWYGYDSNEPIIYKGKSPAVLIWSKVMNNVHSNLPKTTFEVNNNVKMAKICPKTGKTATNKCLNTYTEYFLTGTVPEQCIECSGEIKKTSNNASKNLVTQNNINEDIQDDGP